MYFLSCGKIKIFSTFMKVEEGLLENGKGTRGLGYWFSTCHVSKKAGVWMHRSSFNAGCSSDDLSFQPQRVEPGDPHSRLTRWECLLPHSMNQDNWIDYSFPETEVYQDFLYTAFFFSGNFLYWFSAIFTTFI